MWGPILRQWLLVSPLVTSLLLVAPEAVQPNDATPLDLPIVGRKPALQLATPALEGRELAIHEEEPQPKVFNQGVEIKRDDDYLSTYIALWISAAAESALLGDFEALNTATASLTLPSQQRELANQVAVGPEPEMQASGNEKTRRTSGNNQVSSTSGLSNKIDIFVTGMNAVPVVSVNEGNTGTPETYASHPQESPVLLNADLN